MRLNDLVNVLDLGDLADNVQFHIYWGEDRQHTLVLGEHWSDFMSQTNLKNREVIKVEFVEMLVISIVMRITLGEVKEEDTNN